MKNLHLPEIDYSKPSDYNMPINSYWALKNDSLEEYRYIPNAFTIDECEEIIKIGRHFDIKQSKTGDGRQFSETRKSMNSWLPPCEITNWIYQKIQSHIIDINHHFEFDLHSIENLQFTEYHSEYEGNYTKHIDKFPNSSQPNSHRKLSFSIQLTDPNLYEGGDLLLYNGGNPMIANRDIGCINFFPSYILHEVAPVTKGKRCALVGWIHGPKFR